MRARARVEGTVQGVGFRPYVFKLAGELGLTGWVLNDERGVLLEVEGAEQAVATFLDRLPAEAPPLAAVDSVTTERCPALGETGFEIRASPTGGPPDALVAPDSATCEDCLRELFDPADRRHRYPFINCTNCGPRFTIVRGVPYDRPLTTMAGFEMCARCRAEYEDPADRRFHAQPNACADCGPSVRLIGMDGEADGDANPIAAAAGALVAGAIVAIKGLGGYHLACSAADERAVATLRERKRREDRPLALMAADLDAARSLVELGAGEEELLVGRRCPIVIARRRPGARVAESVAPRTADLGVMLPYTPLHHLLLEVCGAPLVMTSGNLSDEPIAHDDEDAQKRLGAIADLFLVHDRPIHIRTDDSVIRATAGGPLVIRRARGYVPGAIKLPLESARPLLAVGAELKNTFCVAKGRRAWVSHHIGDLENWETLESFRSGIEHFERVFDVRPEVVVHDLHPEYLSTTHALELEGVETLGVQHHHAHFAACLAEHGEQGPAIGVVFDGTGYGEDGTVWGGELLVGGLAHVERVGMLAPVRMPGGERAIREPWRMACVWLEAALGEPVSPLPGIEADRWEQVAALGRSGVASPITTSAGRLFDAAAAILGLRTEVSYEGQAAAELEGAADLGERSSYELEFVGDDPLVLDPRSLLRELVADRDSGTDLALTAARFHNGLAAGIASACARLAEAGGLDTVALSGGVFQNRLLLERTSEQLVGAGLRVLRPVRLPPNDGGISYGQAAIAAASLSTP
ncbi:MAG: carbamoyltransferase HypF [Thermoleophilaceae bacterium]|nr:carbamoyltransferase HypF [Thermoleophilaceae bacterium]